MSHPANTSHQSPVLTGAQPSVGRHVQALVDGLVRDADALRIKVDTLPGGGPWRGNGLGRLTVRRLGARYSLTYRARLRIPDQYEAAPEDLFLSWPL